MREGIPEAISVIGTGACSKSNKYISGGSGISLFPAPKFRRLKEREPPLPRRVTFLRRTD